jgi:DNA modification methylase
MAKTSTKNIFDILGRNPVHPFPARMAPSIAMKAMSNMTGSLRVLDPMMGSGTVLALARSKGHKAYGFDIDPLAVLISKTWTESCCSVEVRELADLVLATANTIHSKLASEEAYPACADEETRSFIDYWFDEDARRQLTALADSISAVDNEGARRILWCAVSRLIIAKKNGVSLAMDLSHSRPHKVFTTAPIKPFDKFIASVEKVLQSVLDKKAVGRGPAPSLKIGDARKLPLRKGSIDVVITSPPYLNAIDYIRCSKFSLVWMGYSIAGLRKLRANSVGTEVGAGAPINDNEIDTIIKALRVRTKLSSQKRSILGKYIDDMRCSIRETSRVLKTGGTVVYVVGENTIRDTYIRTSVIVRHLAQNAGLVLVNHRTRSLPANRRYLPPPSLKNGNMDTRMRHEVILTFSK